MDNGRLGADAGLGGAGWLRELCGLAPRCKRAWFLRAEALETLE